MSLKLGVQEWVLLILLGFLWGGSFFLAKVALAEMQPFTIVLTRVGIASIALFMLLRLMGYKLPTSLRLWYAFSAMGVLNNLIPFSLIFWGQTQIASGLAAILNATTPLFTVLLAHFFTKDEKLSVLKLLGIVLGVAGVAVMIGTDVLDGLQFYDLAQIAILGAALSYAFAGLFGRRFVEIPPLVTATGQVTATTVMMIPIVLVVDQPWTVPMPGMTTWTAILVLGLLCTGLAYIIYFRILKTAGATNLLLVTFIVPISAMLLGAIILGERFEPEHFLGITLIACGLLVLDGRIVSFLAHHMQPRR